jgi:hypothetical protein
MKKVFKIIFIIFAVFFFISAGYHLVAIFARLNDSPFWRNLVFVVINTFTGFCLLKRYRWFIFFFFLLMIQQIYSHGSDLISLWHAQHKIDWISLLVLLVMPAIFIFLLLDRHGKLNKQAA